jgi:membrane protease subunit HflK
MKRVLAVLGLVVLLAYLLTGVTQVRPGERAVVRRFGRVVDTPGPGLYVGLPWGFDRVDRVPVELVRQVQVGYDPTLDDYDQVAPPGQLLTGDHNLVNVQVVVGYTVREDELEDFVVQAEQVEGLVARAAETALAEWVAGHGVDEVLLQGPGRLPAWLVQRTRQQLQPYRLGVEVTSANVAYLLPPDEVKSAFDEVTRAQTAIETRTHEADQRARARLEQARAEEYRIRQYAAAYVDERLQLAQAEAEGFTARLEQARQLRQANPAFLTALWWEEMGKLFQRLNSAGRIDLLDTYLNNGGLDITQVAPSRK